MMQSYVYSITNLVTREFYIGSRGANVRLKRAPEDDLWKEYKSSSKIVQRQVLAFGEASFKAEILSKWDSHDDAYWEEQQIIKDRIHDPLCLNEHYIDPITKKGSFVGRAGVPKTEDHRRKIGLSQKGRPKNSESIQKSAQTQTGKTLSESHRKKLSISGTGKPKTEEHCRKISESKIGKSRPEIIGRKWFNDGTNCFLLDPSLVPPQLLKGRIYSRS